MIDWLKSLACLHIWIIIDKVKIDTGIVEKTELTLQCTKCGRIKYRRPSSFV